MSTCRSHEYAARVSRLIWLQTLLNGLYAIQTIRATRARSADSAPLPSLSRPVQLRDDGTKAFELGGIRTISYSVRLLVLERIP